MLTSGTWGLEEQHFSKSLHLFGVPELCDAFTCIDFNMHKTDMKEIIVKDFLFQGPKGFVCAHNIYSGVRA